MGPDNKNYPTWHPPSAVDPATGRSCTFGHEHGRDPSGSKLLTDLQRIYGGVLFGHGNEQLDVHNQAKGITNGMRHEDHVGHKIEWENNVRLSESVNVGGSSRRYFNVTCDFLMKVHQGTHSQDAFTNNMHELVYAMQCNDGPNGSIGTKTIVTKMVLFGRPGTFSEGGFAGGFKTIAVPAAPSPLNSPNGPSGTLRSLPTIGRVRQSIWVRPGQWSQFSLGSVRGLGLRELHFQRRQPDSVLRPALCGLQPVTLLRSCDAERRGAVDLGVLGQRNRERRGRKGARRRMRSGDQLRRDQDARFRTTIPGRRSTASSASSTSTTR